MEEFKGTTDPGGRSGSNQRDDANTHQLAADQQFVYHLNTTDRSKVGRPNFAPRVGAEGAGDVLDLGRAELSESQLGDPDLRARTDPEEGPVDEGSARYDSLRTRYGAGDGENHQMNMGIAMHSGGRGESVTSYSTGCQVVHGSWYGNFMQTVRRGVTPGSQTGGADEAALADSGELLYTILDGADFACDGQRIALQAGGTLVEDSAKAESSAP